MGGMQSLPKHNFYITKVTNMDLPLVPFLHTIVSLNNTPIRDADPAKLRDLLRTQSVCLEVLDIIINKRFTVTIPMNGCNGDGKMGINVMRLTTIPVPLKAQVTSIRESAKTPLRIGDRVLGIDNSYVENEDELFFEIKSNNEIKLVVLRGDQVEVLECTGPEMGCEVATGLIYTIPVGEYAMKGYTGKVQKVWNISERSDSNDQDILNNLTEDNRNDDETSKSSGCTDKDVQINSRISIDASDAVKNAEADQNILKNAQLNIQNPESIDHIKYEDGPTNPIRYEDGTLSANDLPKSNQEKADEKQTDSAPSPDLNSLMEAISLKKNDEEKEEIKHMPQIPARSLGGNSGFNVHNKDMTASYAYVSPSIVSHNSEEPPINRTNENRIYEEAGLPLENEQFVGTRSSNPKEHARIDHSNAISNGNYTIKNGETRMKDSVFEERKTAECKKNGGISIFDDEDDQLPFDTKTRNPTE